MDHVKKKPEEEAMPTKQKKSTGGMNKRIQQTQQLRITKSLIMITTLAWRRRSLTDCKPNQKNTRTQVNTARTKVKAIRTKVETIRSKVETIIKVETTRTKVKTNRTKVKKIRNKAKK